MREILNKKADDMTVGDNILIYLVLVAAPMIIMAIYAVVITVFTAVKNFVSKKIKAYRDRKPVLVPNPNLEA